jgi:hypothetical protein
MVLYKDELREFYRKLRAVRRLKFMRPKLAQL